jgi:hypothetical protein
MNRWVCLTCALVLTTAGAGRAPADEVFQLCFHHCRSCESSCCYADPCAPRSGPIRRLLRKVFHPCAPPAPCCPPVIPSAPCAPAPAAPFISPTPPAPVSPPLPFPGAPEPGGAAPGYVPPPAFPSARGVLPAPERPLAPVLPQHLTPPLPPPVRLEHFASLERSGGTRREYAPASRRLEDRTNRSGLGGPAGDGK